MNGLRSTYDDYLSPAGLMDDYNAAKSKITPYKGNMGARELVDMANAKGMSVDEVADMMGPDVEEGALEKARKLQGVSGNLIKNDPQAGSGYSDVLPPKAGPVDESPSLEAPMGFSEEDAARQMTRDLSLEDGNLAQALWDQRGIDGDQFGRPVEVPNPDALGLPTFGSGAGTPAVMTPESPFLAPTAPQMPNTLSPDELDFTEGEPLPPIRPQARPWAEKLPENTPLTRSGGLDTDAEVAEATLNLGKIFPETRGKILDMLGVTDDEGAERAGMALLGFGSGLLQGGPDFGAALGAGFSKGADQYVKTKMNQKDAALNDLKAEMASEKLDMDREAFNDRKQQAALDRLNQKNAALGDKEVSYIDPDTGSIVTMDKPTSPLSPSKKLAEFQDTVTTLIYQNPGMTKAEAEKQAARVMGLRADDEDSF